MMRLRDAYMISETPHKAAKVSGKIMLALMLPSSVGKRIHIGRGDV